MEINILLADSKILYLPKVSLETKELLPEYSGIYYVVDENKIVWYVGKAQNIRKRWQGKSHHRIYQLKQLKHKYFDIHYENISLSQLDLREKQQIAKYSPYLNNSPVKSKKVHPTETLLRETIAKISDFAFILGVEPPRREIKEQIIRKGQKQEKILDTPVIHVCLDSVIFKSLFNPQKDGEYSAIITKAFTTHKTYTNKWEFLPSKEYTIFHRLSVNGYIIEVSDLSLRISEQDIKISRIYKQTEIAKERIRALTSESLIQIQQNNSTQQTKKIILERLKPYTSDLVPLFFNEPIDRQFEKQKLEKVSHDYKLSKRGFGSRSSNTDSNSVINELLISRGIDPKKYSREEILRMSRQDRIGLYIQFFHINQKNLFRYGTTIDGSKISSYYAVHGLLNNQEVTSSSKNFTTVYLLTSVERSIWLLVEKYLQDFAKLSNKLHNGEGFTEKYYVSARKYIVPAKVNIKLETINYSAWIPFGMNEKYPTFETAKEEIKKRLHEANLQGLKLTFKKESIAK